MELVVSLITEGYMQTFSIFHKLSFQICVGLPVTLNAKQRYSHLDRALCWDYTERFLLLGSAQKRYLPLLGKWLEIMDLIQTMEGNQECLVFLKAYSMSIRTLFLFC